MGAAFCSQFTAPLKPFIKPRPPAPAQPETPEPRAGVTLNELTIFSLAAGMSDPAERTAYLTRTCGTDEALRNRLEARLAESQANVAPGQHTPPAPASAVAQRPPQSITPAYLEREPQSKDSPALALVPVSAMQFPALPQQLQRQVTFAWGSATLMALAVGALAVTFYFEKDARVRAEVLAKEANAAAEQSLHDREVSEARALESKTAAQRTEDARVKAEQERDAAAAKADEASKEAERLRTETDKARTAAEQGAKAEKEQLLASQRTATIALADSLASLANLQLAAKNYAEAGANARQCLELRTGNGIDGWPLVEARALCGEASLQRNADADAERELTAAGTAIEALGAPANDADRARYLAASKRIVFFFNATGRRKEGAEWKRRLDAVAARPTTPP